MDRRLAYLVGLVTSATRMRRCAYELERALASREETRIRDAATAAVWTLRSGAGLRDAVADYATKETCGARKNVVDG